MAASANVPRMKALFLTACLACSCQASGDILDQIVPILMGTGGGMQVLQFDVDSVEAVSEACSQKFAAYQTVCQAASDSASCSGSTSCLYKKQRAFSAVIGACRSPSDLSELHKAARQYVSDMGRCMKSNNQYCYVSGQNQLASVANSSVSAERLHDVISKICTSPSNCVGKSLAWSTDPVERDACRLSNDGNQWCAKELLDLQHAIAAKPATIPDMSLLCTRCTRRFGYFPKYKIDTYCMNHGGSLCGDRLVAAFNQSGTLAKASPCAKMDIAVPGSCTDACRDFLTGAVAQSGCCLGSALQSAVAAAHSSDEVDRLKAQIAYYQSDCGVKIPDACEGGAAQTSISFNVRITNLASPERKTAELCSLITTEVGDWFQTLPSKISCIYVANSAGSFQIDFYSNSGYVQDDLDYIKQRSDDATLQMPLITSDYWNDATAGITVRISNVQSDNRYTRTSHAYPLSATLLPILIMAIALFFMH